jgi:hypothetical protein
LTPPYTRAAAPTATAIGVTQVIARIFVRPIEGKGAPDRPDPTEEAV